MVSNLLITLVLCICLPAAIIGSPADVNAILGEARQRGGPFLVVSDYNGVLVGKVKGRETSPEYMTHVRSNVLTPLTRTRHTVYVASSKPASQLQSLLGDVPKLGLSAEHDMVTKAPDSHRFSPTIMKSSAWQGKFSKIRIPNDWQVKGEHQFSKIIQFPESYDRSQAQGFLQAELHRVGARDFEAVLDQDKNQVMLANKRRGKGNAVERLLNKGRFGYGISFGDKAADVGMHQAMKERGFAGVIVGPRLGPQAASMGLYHLDGPEEVHAVLQGLAQIP